MVCFIIPILISRYDKIRPMTPSLNTTRKTPRHPTIMIKLGGLAILHNNIKTIRNNRNPTNLGVELHPYVQLTESTKHS